MNTICQIIDDEDDKDDINLINQVEYYIKQNIFTKKASINCTIRSDTFILIDMFYSDNTMKLMNYGYSGDGRYQFYYYRDKYNNIYDFWTYNYFNDSSEIKELIKIYKLT